ncbi:MAG: ThiF family adenylyltransferase [Sphingomonadaceae bacterium]|nr:ThiF family adenylyltransferase [Sphingomonadaceae bacterium]
MPRADGDGGQGFGAAVVEVTNRLRDLFGSRQHRLSVDELRSTYPRRRFTAGWRIRVEFSDGEWRQLDLLVASAFPVAYPRTALVDGPGQLVWPHVESDGVLCLLPVMAEVDVERPADVAIELLARSARLIEELIEDTIVDRDFREEFLTYWWYSAGAAARVVSLLRPEGPSRPARMWRGDDGLLVVGEDDGSLIRWIANRFHDGDAPRRLRTSPAAFVWLPEPPLPSAYPVVGRDVLALAAAAGIEAAGHLADLAAATPDEVIVVFGAEGRGGPGLIATSMRPGKPARGSLRGASDPRARGFRATAIPPLIAASRTFSDIAVDKLNVDRADASWVHGRGKDARSAALLSRTAIIIGCGSLGSSVAMALARAGVGTMHLVDHETLAWANIGRHELGARSIGRNKAIELANTLRGDFPHLEVFGHAIGALSIIDGHLDILEASDLVIATTGSWAAESALNRWHTSAGKPMPIIYGWTESRAASGHAVTVAEGACLRCGIGPTGRPHFEVTQWDGAGESIEEPACGNHFVPYGPVELGAVVDLVATAALDALLQPSGNSEHRMWLGEQRHLSAAGGRWSAAFLKDHRDAIEGARRVDRAWPVDIECPACRSEGLRRAA